jgi:hypothetical protein
MQDQELLPMQRLDAYAVAKELARRVHESRIRDTELRDQATRAAKSCFLTLCEGLPNEGVAMRRKYFTEEVGTQSAKCSCGSCSIDSLCGPLDEARRE